MRLFLRWSTHMLIHVLYIIILLSLIASENELKLSAVNVHEIWWFFNRNLSLLVVLVRHVLKAVELRMLFDQGPIYPERTLIVLIFYIYRWWLKPTHLALPSIGIRSIRAAAIILGHSRPVQIHEIPNVHDRPILLFVLSVVLAALQIYPVDVSWDHLPGHLVWLVHVVSACVGEKLFSGNRLLHYRGRGGSGGGQEAHVLVEVVSRLLSRGLAFSQRVVSIVICHLGDALFAPEVRILRLLPSVVNLIRELMLL